MCLCTKFEVIWTNENRIMSQRDRVIFYYIIYENGLLDILCPPTWLPLYKIMYGEYLRTALTLVIMGRSTQRTFKIELFTLRKNFVQKVVNSNFL